MIIKKKYDNYNLKQLSFININNSNNTTYQDFLNINSKKYYLNHIQKKYK